MEVGSLPNIIEIVKKAAIEAVEATNPCALLYGVVVGTNPIKINIEQKLTLEIDHLILTNSVKDFKIEVELNHLTEEDNFLDTNHTHPNVIAAAFDSTHKHTIEGKKKLIVHLGLKQGEKVLLLRVQGGQKYIVIDRVRE